MIVEAVAPLAGSVDRNSLVAKDNLYRLVVAPLAGSVDRNRRLWYPAFDGFSRSPRGERG